MKYNIDQPREIFEGDSITFTVAVDADLTGYYARCQITDQEDTSISYANTLAGGTDEISISVASGGTESVITIEVPEDDTVGLEENCQLEVEVESLTGVKTTFRSEFKLIPEDLGWTTP
jgi:hypothetical protein